MTKARDKILVAARRIHAQHGLDALSLRRVAELVGVTPMAIYRHFDDKEALIDALVAEGFALWEVRLARAARARTPRKRVEAGLMAYAEFAIDEPRLFELMFLVPRRRVPRAPQSLERSESKAFSAMIAAVQEAMDRGELVRGKPAETILLAWSTAHGLIALHFSGRFGGDESVFRAAYSGTVRQLLGLLSPA